MSNCLEEKQVLSFWILFVKENRKITFKICENKEEGIKEGLKILENSYLPESEKTNFKKKLYIHVSIQINSTHRNIRLDLDQRKIINKHMEPIDNLWIHFNLNRFKWNIYLNKEQVFCKYLCYKKSISDDGHEQYVDKRCNIIISKIIFL